jgi:hypothetical protein
MLSGPMWCGECGFRVEDKQQADNPFVWQENEDEVKHRPIEKAVLQDLYEAWKAEHETDMDFGEWLIYGWRLDEGENDDQES